MHHWVGHLPDASGALTQQAAGQRAWSTHWSPCRSSQVGDGCFLNTYTTLVVRRLALLKDTHTHTLRARLVAQQKESRAWRQKCKPAGAWQLAACCMGAAAGMPAPSLWRFLGGEGCQRNSCSLHKGNRGLSGSIRIRQSVGPCQEEACVRPLQDKNKLFAAQSQMLRTKLASACCAPNCCTPLSP
jgi:hypothetical protein